MRNLSSVIKQLQEVIPESNYQLKDELDYIEYNIGYTPPELMVERWNEVYESLVSNLPKNPTENWQWEVFSIFSTRPIDELKAMWQGEE